MPASPALPGLFLCFAATVLLIFVSISSPTWDKIYFLQVTNGGSTTHFGVFGYTGSKVAIGYDFSAVAPNVNLSSSLVHNITKVLILHPIAAALAGLSVLFGICGAAYHRAGTVLMTLLASLATLITLVIFVLDMILFGIARNRFRDHGFQADFGNACWLTLGALIALLLGACTSACGVFGRYRRHGTTY